MNRRILFWALLLASILAILAVIWFLPHGRDAWRGMMDNPSNDKGVTPAVEQTPSQAEETPSAALPENSVIDPESGQYVLYNELTILASGENVEAIVAEFKGEIVLHVKETDTYQVRFPVKDLGELKQIREALESKGLTVYYSTVIIP